jgi:hypothetical protein
LAAILGQSSEHSFATGPVMADPFISPFGLIMTPALSIEIVIDKQISFNEIYFILIKIIIKLTYLQSKQNIPLFFGMLFFI